MSDTLRLTSTYEEPDERGWIAARIVQVPGAISQGRTRDDARENVIDALRVCSRRTTTWTSQTASDSSSRSLSEARESRAGHDPHGVR
jgi:hypothetical protein